MGEQAFLRELAEHLRAARGRAGLSVTELARRAGVSRRWVTEAEAGRANPSLLKLARLAAATGVPLSELCDLSLAGYGGGRVALVGLRGAGKSTIGPSLARRLEAPFVELDRRVERLAGMPLGTIFDLHGADAFHRFEAEALEEVLAEGDRLVLATGGSIVDSPETFERLLATCRTVWLRADPADHFARVLAQGDRRPMRDRPRAREELASLLERRRPLYERCELLVDTSREDVDACAARIAAAVEEP